MKKSKSEQSALGKNWRLELELKVAHNMLLPTSLEKTREPLIRRIQQEITNQRKKKVEVPP